jgi:hypothetical protein
VWSKARQSDSRTRTREHRDERLPPSPNTLQRSANALETILAWFWILRTSCRIFGLPLPLALDRGLNPWSLDWVGPRDLDWSITEHSASQREGSSPNHWEVGDLGSTRCSGEGDGWDPEWDKVSENSDVVGEAEEDPAKAEEPAEEMEADMETRRGGRKSMSLRYSRSSPSIDTNSSLASPPLGNWLLPRLSPECLAPTQRLFEGGLELVTWSCEEVEFSLNLLPPLLRLSTVVCVVACTVGMGREEGLW